MAEPTIVCPNCKTEIKLNESLAGPLLEATRRDFEKRLKQKDTDLAAKLKEEGAKIATEEARKAKLALSSELDQKTRAVADLEKTLTENNAKLAEAQKAQADLLRKQRELDTKLREADLSVEKRVQEGLNATREQARKEVEGELKLKVAEKEQTISSMQKQIEELKRRAEQGSQQLQGEVMELELESLLRTRFPRDTIEPVPKGVHGGDVLHHVLGPIGQACGTILWESKRTKGWSDAWLVKLREDQREAFSSMQEDLDKEKKAITKQWAKREVQIERVMQATVGLYGDLQGIAGSTLQEIEGLELKTLEAPKD